MKRVRQVIAYKHYFADFLSNLDTKIQDKVFKIIEAIETLERVPTHYLSSIQGVKGLYEARIKLGSNIWRVFCFFDGDRLVILLNGFQKKSQKTPKNEIKRAEQLMNAYFDDKKETT